MRMVSAAMVCAAAISGIGVVLTGLIGAASGATNDPPVIVHGDLFARGLTFGTVELPARLDHHGGVLRLAENNQNQELKTTGNPSVAPLKWVGLLKNPTPTKRSPDQYEYCTGQFITANVVLTAGHCLNDLAAGRKYDLTKQTFTLQYQNGVGSQTFKTVCGAASTLWTVPANFASMPPEQKFSAMLAAQQHDIAMILVDGNSPTGFMPYQLDWKGKINRAVRVGYAVDILDGEIVQQALGPVFFAGDISLFAPYATPSLVAHWAAITNLTQGISGGAWIANFDTSGGAGHNALLAVTSFNSAAYPGAVFAAYLTAAEFNPLLKFVSNGCK